MHVRLRVALVVFAAAVFSEGTWELAAQRRKLRKFESPTSGSTAPR